LTKLTTHSVQHTQSTAQRTSALTYRFQITKCRYAAVVPDCWVEWLVLSVSERVVCFIQTRQMAALMWTDGRCSHRCRWLHWLLSWSSASSAWRRSSVLWRGVTPYSRGASQSILRLESMLAQLWRLAAADTPIRWRVCGQARYQWLVSGLLTWRVRRRAISRSTLTTSARRWSHRGRRPRCRCLNYARRRRLLLPDHTPTPTCSRLPLDNYNR